MATGLLTIEPTEWERAEAYFQQNPNAVKFKKAKNQAGNQHSFIKVGDEIYAMANGEYLGEGSFGKVKIVQNKAGENFAVKIEGRGLRSEHNTELKIMLELGYIKGQVARTLDRAKTFLKNSPFTTREKLYTVTEFVEGKELGASLYQNYQNIRTGQEKSISDLNMFLIALKSCEAVKALHEKNIIHADVKPANLMLNQKDDMIFIVSVDYGLSKKVNPTSKEYLTVSSGSPLYMAPELFKGPAIYSPASDVFALGRMFAVNLGLPRAIYQPMLENHRLNRAGLDSSMMRIINTLEARSDYSSLSEQQKADVQAIKLKAQAGVLQSLKNVDPVRHYSQTKDSTPAFGVVKWAFQTSKAAGRAITGKGKAREAQIELINNAFKSLKDPNDLTPENEKLKNIYTVLQGVREDISKERNVFSSGMKKMCEKMMRELELVEPALKKLPLPASDRGILGRVESTIKIEDSDSQDNSSRSPSRRGP